MALFDKHSTGGTQVSKVDHQDAVGTLLVLRLLSRSNPLGLADGPAEKSIIQCEGDDDLEIITDNQRVLISVKDTLLSESKIHSEYQRLKGITQKRGGVQSSTIGLVTVGAVSTDFVSTKNDLESARNMMMGKDVDGQQRVRDDFAAKHPKLGSDCIADLYLDIAPELFSNEFSALCSQELRRVLPIVDYTDATTLTIVNSIRDVFAEGRHRRKSVTAADIRTRISEQILPLPLLTTFVDYVRTDLGYVVDPSLRASMRERVREVRSAMRTAMWRYRRQNWRRVLLNASLRSAVNCLACNHPLMANFFGMTAKGTACPDCGYTPFVTLFYACRCGEPVPIVEQPALSATGMINEVVAALTSKTCPACKGSLVVEEYQTRLFELNIPADPNLDIDKRLIQMRETLGWGKNSDFYSGADPLQALLSRRQDISGAPINSTLHQPNGHRKRIVVRRPRTADPNGSAS